MDKQKQGGFTRFLNGVERVGNKMCDPVTLFVCICLIIIICSAIFNGATVVNPASGADVTITSLLLRLRILYGCSPASPPTSRASPL